MAADRQGDFPLATVTVRVRGRVQGVGFRWFVRREARRLGLRGWVTNLPDGTVRVAAAGPPEALSRLEAALQTGPPGAAVAGIDPEPAVPPETLPDPFQIR